jgi:hypothetical protein
MRINGKANIVYAAACVGIVYNPRSNVQKFFGGQILDNVSSKQLGKDTKFHTEEISCIAMCPERRYVASGQLGMKPWVFIWDSYEL